LELIVGLGDPANLGALLRSAEALGASRVVLTRECASPYLPKSLKASANSAFRMRLALGPSLREFKLNTAFGLDMDGEDLAKFKWPKDAYLVLGEEGQGLPELNLKKLKIPMLGSVESLNATVAAAIALFTYRSGN
jgi:TrmH family RNA methyltransferase